MPYIIQGQYTINTNNMTGYHKMNYPKNDLASVFVHWDDKLKRNVPTENKLQEDKIYEK